MSNQIYEFYCGLNKCLEFHWYVFVSEMTWACNVSSWTLNITN